MMTLTQIVNGRHSRAVPPLYRVSVGEAMHSGVLAVPLTAPLSEVAETMAKHRVHCVVALGERTHDGPGRVWGLVTDLELTRIACTEGLQGRTAGGSATTRVVTVEPADTVHHAAELMAAHEVSHVIVVDPLMDRPVGVLSTLDVAGVLVDGLPRPKGPAYYVAQVMTPTVLTVQADASLKDVAQLLSDHGISGVPVVERKRVLGVVSQTDIVAKEQGPVAKRGRFASWFARPTKTADRERLEARTAGDVMTSPAITIESWRTVAEAAALMLSRDVDRLPVLKNGKLEGIITRADLVGAFSRSDSEIERDIREEVLLRSFWIPEGDVEVRVRKGDVTLTGTVESELIAELLPDAIRRVPGVVDVRAKLHAAVTPGEPHQFERIISPR
jgi:CBS domain-containing protein